MLFEGQTGKSPDISMEQMLVASSVDLLESTTRPGPAELAPYILLRFATLPYAALEHLRPPATSELVARQLRAESAMAAEAASLDPALFALVSRIEPGDKHYRRQVLQLKREVHNATCTALAGEIRGRIQEDFRAEGAELEASLVRWLTAQELLRKTQSELEPQLQDDIARVLRPALRAALQSPMFKRALAMASSGLIAHARRESRLPSKIQPDSFERSLLGYLTRAAAKTSPFSSFMSTTALGIDPRPDGRPEAEGLQHSCRMRLNRGVVARLRRVMASRGVGSPMVKANATIALLGGQRYRALCSRNVVVLGRPWRQQAVTTFQLHDSLSGVLLAHLSDPPAPPAVWQSRFLDAGVPPERVVELVPQLLERDLLQLDVGTDAFDPQPERSLPGMQSEEAEGACEVVAPVRRLVAACEALDAGEIDGDRESQIAGLRDLELQALGDRSQEPFQNIALEDCWSSGMAGGIGSGQLVALDDVSRFLSGQIGISPTYARLRDRFTAKYGKNGRCNDVLGFLVEQGTQLVAAREYGDTRAEEVHPAPAGATLAVTLQTQIVAAEAGTEPLMVVNKVFEGAGWLAARYAFGETAEHRTLREGLTRWMDSVAGGRLPVDLIINGDSNDLQAHPRLTERVLRWPGEPLRDGTPGAVDIGDLALVHDAGRDLLELVDRQGRGIHLCYLGATMASPSWGIAYALAILTQPYQLMRPAHKPSADESRGEVEFVPRRMAGRAVLQRAHWWVSTAYLQRTWFARAGAARLVDVRREAARLNLPEVFFARRQASLAGVSSSVLDANKKPLWVDVLNPFCLALVERLAANVEWLCFTEALPGPSEQWLEIDKQPHVSELQTEILLRAV